MHGLQQLLNLLTSGSKLFQGNRRQLLANFYGDNAPADNLLLPTQISAVEAIGLGYCAVVDMVSASAQLNPHVFLGLRCAISCVDDGGDKVTRSGSVYAAWQLGSDGGRALYRFLLVDSFQLLHHKIRSRIFQDKTLQAISTKVFTEHTQANPALADALALAHQTKLGTQNHSFSVQYNESDFRFLRRRFFEEGINYFIDHTASGNKVVTVDSSDSLKSAGAFAFHREGDAKVGDSVLSFGTQHTQHIPSSTHTSHDYKTGADFSAASVSSDSEESNDLNSTLGSSLFRGAYKRKDDQALMSQSDAQQKAADRRKNIYAFTAGARRLIAGKTFGLKTHPTLDSTYTCYAQALYAHNNLDFLDRARVTLWHAQAQEQQRILQQHLNALPFGPVCSDAFTVLSHLALTLNEEVQATHSKPSLPVYRCAGMALKKDTPIAPDYQAETYAPYRHALHKPSANGLQSATVVGPKGEVIHTDALGRIRVQFRFALAEDHLDGGADFDDRSSCWIRVLSPHASTQYGQLSLPRIGDEVMVQFIENDIDRPLVIGSVYNGLNQPVSFRNVSELPADKALSGIKSQTLDGVDKNELIVDDTNGEPRIQLSTSHARSELNLGYLTHPRAKGKAEARGNGAELRTDAQLALRAAKGVLISAEPQIDAGGNQLARDALQSLAEAGLNLSDALDKSAQTHKAAQWQHGSSAYLKTLNTQITEWAFGQNIESEKSKTGKDQKLVAITAPDGFIATAPAAMALSSGANLELLSQSDIRQAAAQRLVHNAGERISLFAEGIKDRKAKSESDIGISAIAARGKINIEAHKADIEITAKNNVHFYSVTDKTDIAAKNEIRINAGGSYIKINAGGIEVATTGNINTKGAILNIDSGSSSKYSFPSLPKSVAMPLAALALKALDASIQLKRVEPKSLTDAVAQLGKRREELSSSGKYTEKYTQQEKMRMATTNELNDKYVVRVVEAERANDSDFLGYFDGEKVKFWATTFDMLEDKDSDLNLVTDAIGINRKKDADYTMIIVDKDQALQKEGTLTINPTAENLSKFGLQELGKKIVHPELVPEVMTEAYVSKYHDIYTQLSPEAFGDAKDLDEALDAQGLTSHEKKQFRCRRSLHNGFGANEHYTGNGLTKNLRDTDGSEPYGVMETFTYDKNPKTIGELTKGDEPLAVTVALTPIPGFNYG